MAAMAQEAKSDPADTGEIIVTAQRRSENLQGVPLAVTAIGGAVLERAQITDVVSLQTSTPGFNAVTSSRPATSTTFSLRGFGTSGNDPGFEAAVALVVDDVYRARSGAGLGDLVDISNIEVLRGPQGTLFGKNTTAGVIKVTTRRPNLTDFEGFADATVGNYSLVRVRTAANLPIISDKAALRVSFGYQSRDGFIKDPFTRATYNDRNRFTITGKFLAEITPDIEAYIVADYSEADENCCQPQRFTNADRPYVAYLAGVAAANGSSYPIVPTYGTSYSAANAPMANNNKDRGIQLQLKADLGGGMQLTSVTAARKFDDLIDADVDYTGADLLRFKVGFGLKTFTQELRLQGSAFDDKLDWLVGGFLSDERIRYSESVGIGAATLGYAAILSPSFAGLYPAQADAAGNHASQNTKSYSLFTHNIFEITEGLKLTAGLRWTTEKKHGVNTPYYNNPASQLPYSGYVALGFQSYAYDMNYKKSDFSGTASLSYQWTPAIMTYASYSRGFKAGGFALGRDGGGPVYSRVASCSTSGAVAYSAPALTIYQCDPVDPRFKAESVDSYEVGLRSQFFDRRLTLNLTAFRADITDLQINTHTGTGYFASNAGTARSQGFEAETSLRVVPGITLNANLTYLDTSFGPDVPSVVSGEPSPAGQALTGATKWSGAVSANLDLPVTAKVDFFARPELYFRSSAYTLTRVGSDGLPLKIPSYQLINFSAGVRIDRRFEVSAFCRNCADKTYPSLIFTSVFQPGSKDVFPGNPAEYGLSLRYEW
jgi:outer membrane receptor protein involved in Fe transport